MFSVLAALVTLGGLVNAQGYITLPFTKDKLDSSFSKREVVGNLEKQKTTYAVNFSLGNQEQKAFVDTSSSDLWVYGPEASTDYTYNPSGAESSNFNFELRYLDGSKAEGSIYKDKLTLGGVGVDVDFGVVDTFDGSSLFGKLGLGLLDAKGGCIEEKSTHHSYPFVLKNAGEIETAAYSLNLNSNNPSVGAIVFGAVDKERYTGQLQMLDGQSDDHFAAQFTVNGTSLIGALDSGSIYTFLPDDIVSSLAASMGATWNNLGRIYMVDRHYIEQDLEFDFAGTKITMKSSDLVEFPGSGPRGFLTVVPASLRDDRIVLGDSFLKCAYTVYDLENNRMAIAQASRSDGPPNYQPITSAGIPEASY